MTEQIDPGLLRGSGRYRRGRCPRCEAREASLSVDLVAGRARCFRGSCGWRGQVRDGLVRSFDEVRELDRRDRSDRERRVARVLGACAPIDPRGPVAAYLRSRHLVAPWPSDLREAVIWHPPSRREMPCLVAVVRDVDGRPIGAMRTWTPGGRRPDHEPRRMAIGPIAGGSVRLGSAQDRVVLVEGVEDGLAAMQMWPDLGPAWACLSTSGLRRVELPAFIRRVVIVGDRDPHHAGEVAARAAARRLREEARSVDIYLPDDAGAKDAADLLAAARSGA